MMFDWPTEECEERWNEDCRHRRNYFEADFNYYDVTVKLRYLHESVKSIFCEVRGKRIWVPKKLIRNKVVRKHGVETECYVHQIIEDIIEKSNPK